MSEEQAKYETELVDTPPNRWSLNGEGDEFAHYLDKERIDLTLGKFTDDELANGVFMYGDRPLDVAKALDPTIEYYPPISWLTAGKERIRWLSRKLVAVEQRIAELEAALKEKE